MRERNPIWLVVVATVLVFAAGPFAGSFADEKEHKQPGEKVDLPETAAQIWHEIDEHVELLDTTISNEKLADVHRIAFAIRDLAKGLPDKSKDLSAAKLKLLKGYVERIAEHAKNLDTYGDAGNKSKTQAEFEQLNKRLDYMRKLYPDSMFESGEHHHS